MTNGPQYHDFSCNIDDGPFCYGLEVASDQGWGAADTEKEIEVTTKMNELIVENDKMYRNSNDQGAKAAGVKIVEGQQLFQLSFFSFDQWTSNVTQYYEDVAGIEKVSSLFKSKKDPPTFAEALTRQQKEARFDHD